MRVLIQTNYGDMTVLLYDDTPLHRDNFMKLVDSAYFDSLLFHRVINKFMIQGGDPDSKGAPSGLRLGNGGPGYTLPAEFVPGRYHRRGALAAAREGDEVNPEKRSSGSQFYVVQGKTFTRTDLLAMQESFNEAKKVNYLQQELNKPENKPAMDALVYYRNARMSYQYDSLIRSYDPMCEAYLDSVGPVKFTEEQLDLYSTVGGTPHLDGGYTVFGEIVEGLEVLNTISTVQTDRYDRPVKDVMILGVKYVK